MHAVAREACLIVLSDAVVNIPLAQSDIRNELIAAQIRRALLADS